jgi:U4/U6.U5 tri-snRNP component SNU23
MSTNLNYKQVANVSRRTWDVETYEKRAKERVNNEENTSKRKSNNNEGPLPPALDGDGVELNREEFVPAAAGAAGPHMSKRAFLKARTNKVNGLDSKVGSVEIINPDAAATTKSAIATPGVASKDAAITKSGIGWHCKVCDCFLRDSHTYLDHINGRKHQRNLGYSMRVERSTKDQVASRLAALAKEKEKSSSKLDLEYEQDEDEMYHDIVKAKDEELKRKQEERKKERTERKKKKKEQQKLQPQEPLSADASEEASKDAEENEEVEEGDNEVEDGGINPELAAMMGFSGFK